VENLVSQQNHHFRYLLGITGLLLYIKINITV